MRDLHILPKLRDSLTYVYAEHAVVQRYRQAVELVDKEGKTALPIATLSLLILGPGTSITHEAVKLLAENGCSILWVGEESMRFYAYGSGETRKGYRLLQQAQLVCDPVQHLEVVMRMYQFRFDEPLEPNLSIEQIRGREGARVRSVYRIHSRRFGVKWQGRKYDRGSWEKTDPVNRALSAANALLNGICHAAIISGGYSPGLGFVHTGKHLSFVYDVADLYKTEFTIPAAFETAALGAEQIERRVRQLMRQRIKEGKLLQRILPDVDKLLRLESEQDDIYDSDGALPSPLWDGGEHIDWEDES